MEALRRTISLAEASEYYRISPKDVDLPASLIGRYFNELFRQFAALSSLRHPITVISSTGILTMCPSDAAFAISLGPTHPWLTIIAKETLVFRCAGFSPALSLLMPTFSFLTGPAYLTIHLLPCWNAPLPLTINCKSIASVICLCPIIIHARPLD